jgi:YbbR domain-containing protein
VNLNRNNGNGGNGNRWDWPTLPQLLLAGGRGLGQHWMLATFSLVAAFALWFVIQDVENPRVNGSVPPESDAPAIAVQPLNVPSGYVVAAPDPVRVRVEARKDDMANLSPSDFEAAIDLKDEPVDVSVPVRVDVHSKRSGVRVTGVTPSTVTVKIVKAAVRSMNVNVHRNGQLPSNFTEGSLPVIDPAKVTVSGLPDLVDSVDTVDLDVDMSNVRSSSPIEGPLVARTATGTPVTVSLSATRAKVTFSITQAFEQRTIGLQPNIAGQPAKGYHVTNVLVDPIAVTVTGPPKDVDGIQDGIGVERLDISGAATNVNAIRKVTNLPNISIDHETVNVTVVIEPIECGIEGAPSAGCGAATFVVAPELSKAPEGLNLDPNTEVSVQVSVYGPLDKLDALKVSDIKATVSLANGKAGTATYPVSILLPAGLTAVTPDPVSITLVPTS